MQDASADLQGLRGQIREQAARRRAEVAASVPLTPQAPPPWTFNWLEGRRRLQVAAAMAHIANPPQLQDSRGLKRWLSNLIAKVVIRLTRFMTNRQTSCNVCLLETMHDLASGLHEIETRTIQNQEQIRHLEACLARLQIGGDGPARAERQAG
jgi:hypothetical protein